MDEQTQELGVIVTVCLTLVILMAIIGGCVKRVDIWFNYYKAVGTNGVPPYPERPPQ